MGEIVVMSSRRNPREDDAADRKSMGRKEKRKK